MNAFAVLLMIYETHYLGLNCCNLHFGTTNRRASVLLYAHILVDISYNFIHFIDGLLA